MRTLCLNRYGGSRPSVGSPGIGLGEKFYESKHSICGSEQSFLEMLQFNEGLDGTSSVRVRCFDIDSSVDYIFS